MASDLTNFPWDSQLCKIDFEADGYNKKELLYHPVGDDQEGEPAKRNAEWRVRRFRHWNTSAPNATNIDELDSAFAYSMLIERNAEYYTTVIILPTVLIASIHIIGMFTPSNAGGERGEKATFGLTTLLAMAVILGMVGEEMPKISKEMPLLAKFVIAEMSITVITIIIAVVMVFSHERVLCRGTPAPSWLRKMLLRQKKKKLLPSPSQAVVAANDCQADGLIGLERQALLETLHKIREEIDSSNEEYETTRDWQRIFHRIDFLLMWLFLVANSVIVMVLLIPAFKERELEDALLKRQGFHGLH